MVQNFLNAKTCKREKKQYSENMANFEAFLENLLEHTPLISEECRLKGVYIFSGGFLY